MGEQSAVVWKRLYLRPVAARRSAFGMRTGPPKALEAPKPTSSIRTKRTLGAPSGGRSGTIGGNVVSGSFASYVVSPAGVMSGIGSTSRGRSAMVVLQGFAVRPILSAGGPAIIVRMG